MATEKIGKWSEDRMKDAITRVIDKNRPISLREAVFHFSVPKSTLADRIKHLKSGKVIDIAPEMGCLKKPFQMS